jgi:hypothetical protein
MAANNNQLIKAFKQLPENVQSTFDGMENLLEDGRWSYDIAVAYAFQTIERVRRTTLYLILVRGLNLNPKTTWEAIDGHELHDNAFWVLLERSLENSFSKALKQALRKAKSTRNKIAHGQDWTDAAARMALVEAFSFMHKFSDEIIERAQFDPCGSYQGRLAVGKKGTRLDPRSSRLILRGLGFFSPKSNKSKERSELELE